ncbi:MAG TPA: hypothetical protein VLH86_02140 [Patescibacteria group bacterium]|nr:hypothetical protein [Patescibacteria group bacterium]
MKILLLVCLVAVVMAFPTKSRCVDGAACGGVSYTVPAGNNCHGVVERPLLARFVQVNMYYGFHEECGA